MHAILYWLASALDIDDGYSLPSVSGTRLPIENNSFLKISFSSQLPEPVEYVMGQFVVPPSDTCGADTIQESLSSWAGQSDGKPS